MPPIILAGHPSIRKAYHTTFGPVMLSPFASLQSKLREASRHFSALFELTNAGFFVRRGGIDFCPLWQQALKGCAVKVLDLSHYKSGPRVIPAKGGIQISRYTPGPRVIPAKAGIQTEAKELNCDLTQDSQYLEKQKESLMNPSTPIKLILLNCSCSHMRPVLFSAHVRPDLYQRHSSVQHGRISRCAWDWPL